MKRTNAYFEFLSKVLSETVENVEADFKIDDIYNQLYSIIDNELMSEIETIGEPQKYKIVDELKKILFEYKIRLYYNYLFNKTIVTFYGMDNAISILKKYFGLKKALLNDDIRSSIPFIFRSDPEENNVELLNFPENTVGLTRKEYKLIGALRKKRILFENLAMVISFPLNNDLCNTAFTVLDKELGSVYHKAVASMTDVIVTNRKNVNEKIFERFPYVKTVLVLENVGSFRKKNIIKICRRKSCEVKFVKIDTIFDEVRSLNICSKNTMLALRIEEKIGEIIDFIAQKINFNKTKFNVLNSDVLNNVDKKILAMLQEQRKNLRLQIDTDLSKYKKLKEICVVISDKSRLLEEEIERVLGRTDPEEYTYHFDELEILYGIYTQLLSTALFDESVAPRLKVLCGRIGKYDDEYAAVAEAARKVIVLQSYKKSEIDEIVKRRSASLSLLKTKLNIAYALNIYPEMLADEYYRFGEEPQTPLQYYYYGISCIEHNEKVKGKAALMFALENGITKAGDYLLNKFADVDIKELAKLCVPNACYNYAMSRKESDPFFYTTYLKIAAAFAHTDALKQLADDLYKQVRSSFNSEIAHECLGYYMALININEKKFKIAYFNIGFILYKLEDYENAKSAYMKSDCGAGYYNIGLMYEDGKGFSVDLEEALNYFKLSKEKGELSANEACDRVAEKIEAEKAKRETSEDTDYSLRTFFDRYYSIDSGCVTAGTKILLSDNSYINVENVSSDFCIRNCEGGISYTTDEIIVNRNVQELYSINDDEPFMSLEHAVLTQRGWCSLNPDLSNEINSNYNVKKLEMGDVIEKIELVNGEISYKNVTVKKINIACNSEELTCYDLHFYNGINSYYANGYPCLLNYPTFTLSSLKARLNKMSEAEKEKFVEMCTNYSQTLEQIFGKTNIAMLFADIISTRK